MSDSCLQSTHHNLLVTFPFFRCVSVVLAVLVALLVAHDLRVADAAAGEPEGSDGGTLHGLGGLRAVLSAGGRGGQREQHLKRGLVTGGTS